MHNYLDIITTTTNTDSIAFSGRRRSSSCSSASSSRTQEAGARCRGPLHRQWCLLLPSRWERTNSSNLEIWWSETSNFSGASPLWVTPTPNASRVKPSSAPTFLECLYLSPQQFFAIFFRQTILFKSKYWKQQKPIPQNRGNVPRNRGNVPQNWGNVPQNRDPTSLELRLTFPFNKWW